MEEQVKNYSCTKRYKCILTTAAIIALSLSTAYLYFKHSEQVKLIEHQKHAINELKVIIDRGNSDDGEISNVDRLFNRNFFSFQKHFTDIAELFSNTRHDKDFNYALDSSYHYHSISSNGNEYIIKLAVPGFSKNDILLELSDNILKVSNKTSTTEGANGSAEKTGSSNDTPSNIGQSFQTVKIPKNIDKDSIQATLNNGLLTVVLQKSDLSIQKEIKTIPIN